LLKSNCWHFRVLASRAQDGVNAKANARLAVLRALISAHALKHSNVSGDLVAVIGFGDSYPILPDVPFDPQNRRAEITTAVSRGAACHRGVPQADGRLQQGLR
jgi:hypothetical protein